MFKKRKFFSPALHMEVERWKYYMPMDVYISTFGRFKDEDGNILPCTSKGNYLVFRGQLVHRLVMTVFCPIPGCAGLTIDHLDHNTRNNHISNLEWVTEEENKARAKRDNEQNLKTMLEQHEEEMKKYRAATSGALCVRLNGTVVPIETAREILLNSKDLKNSKQKVEKVLFAIKTGDVAATTEISIGNFCVTAVKGE